MVVKTYMDMDQDSEEEKQQYLGLALHLASEFFLRNPNKDVRLLVACCLADIFRIYAPEAPYTSHDKLKVKEWTSSRNYGLASVILLLLVKNKQSPHYHHQIYLQSRWRSNVGFITKTPPHATHYDQPEGVIPATRLTVQVSSPGNLPLHHQAVKRTGRHQESSVQQILLPPGGLKIILNFNDC